MDCTKLDWNPLESAPSHSALAGVLAGLVFAGIVLLFADQRPRPQRARVVMLFTGALLVFTIASFVFGVVAGEQLCAKAWTETMLGAGLLGLGALGIFGGVTWLINTYEEGHPRATTLAKVCTYATALIVGYYLQVTTNDYLNYMSASQLNQPPNWLVGTVDASMWIFIALIAITLASRHLARKRLAHKTAAASKSTSEIDTKINERLDRAASAAAYLSVGYVIVVAVIIGALLSSNRDEWEPATPTFVVMTATLLSLALPTLALLAQLWALPYRTTAFLITAHAAKRVPPTPANTSPTGSPTSDPQRQAQFVPAGPITMARLRQRQDTYLSTHYMGLHVTIVSIALGIAGVTAANLLASDQLALEYHLLFGMLWLASFVATVTAFAATVVGCFTLPAQTPSIWDLIFPLLIAVAEFLLYVIVAPPFSTLTADFKTIAYWFFCMTAFCLLAVGAIARVRLVFQRTSYDVEAQTHMDWYLGRLRLDMAGAGTTAALGLTGGILSLTFPVQLWIAYCFAVLIILALTGAVIGHEKIGRHWRDALQPPP